MSMAADVAAAVDAAFTALEHLVGTIQIRRATPGAYNTTTHTFSEATADTAFTGAVTKVEQVLDGQTARTVRHLLLKPGAISPVAGDHAVIGADIFKVLAVRPIKPGSVVLAWELEVAL